MNWLRFTLLALACYRLAEMGSSEEGPAAIFARLRRKVPAKTNPGRGIRCVLCWSVWVAAALTGYVLWLGWCSVDEAPVLWFAVSGAAILFHLAFSKGR
jgi:hypothetical protein